MTYLSLKHIIQAVLFRHIHMLTLADGGDTILSKLYSSLFPDPRPRCVVPITPGLEHQRRPSWLAVILLFFSRPMRQIWTKLAAGFVIGLICDTASNTNNIFTRL